jgi:hypothetical protein
MIEIEFSALSRQCLNRRIPSKEQLEQQLNAIINERNEKAIKIDWQFSLNNARNKMNSRYAQVNEQNQKFK